jgi:hypothetical protein
MVSAVKAHDVEPTRGETEARRGERLGRAYARQRRGIPPLAGGSYAVGFLYGYRAEQRRHRPGDN